MFSTSILYYCFRRESNQFPHKQLSLKRIQWGNDVTNFRQNSSQFPSVWFSWTELWPELAAISAPLRVPEAEYSLSSRWKGSWSPAHPEVWESGSGRPLQVEYILVVFTMPGAKANNQTLEERHFDHFRFNYHCFRYRYNCRSLIKVKISTDKVRRALGSVGCRLIVTMLKNLKTALFQTFSTWHPNTFCPYCIILT